MPRPGAFAGRVAASPPQTLPARSRWRCSGAPEPSPLLPAPSEGSGDRLAVQGLQRNKGQFSSIHGCGTLGTVTLFLPLRRWQRIRLTRHLPVPCVGTGMGVPGAALKQEVHPWGPLPGVPAQPRPLRPVMKLPKR